VVVGVVAGWVEVPVDVKVRILTTMDMAGLDGVQCRRGMVEKVPVVGDDHLGESEPLENGNKPLPGLWIEVVGRFIEEEQFRSHGEDCRQGDQFFFSTGKTMGDPFLKTVQAQILQGLYGNFGCFGGRVAKVQRAKGNILKDCWGKELVIRVLKQVPHLPSQGPEILAIPNCPAVEIQVAPVRAEEAYQEVEECGFAAPVWADDTHPAVGDDEVKASQYRGRCLGVAVANLAQFKHCRRFRP
jgi:hypothetical protein